jgi:hypothetical protein
MLCAISSVKVTKKTQKHAAANSGTYQLFMASGARA